MSNWIEWSGGECPVAAGTIVEVRDAMGRTWGPGSAEVPEWGHCVGFDNIIAYRVVSAPEGEREPAIDPLRAQAAIAAMQGMYAASHGWPSFNDHKEVANRAVAQADALLSALKGKE